MARKPKKILAQETSALRLKMHELIENGLSEYDALAEVMPKDRNRTHKLKLWKERGLWPVPDSELKQEALRSSKKDSNESLVKNTKDKDLTDRIYADTPQPSLLNHKNLESAPETEAESDLVSSTNSLPMSRKTASAMAELYESGVLTEMVRWWQTTQGSGVDLSRARPRFEGEMVNSSVYVNREIWERAKLKCKGEKTATGGTMSQLVELLLWKYLGSPEDLVE